MQQYDREIFQFHKGTIKTDILRSIYIRDEKFQFHKGTIKTHAMDIIIPMKVPFQFHKGTIKTECWNQERQPPSNFNSIKVRLKQFCQSFV